MSARYPRTTGGEPCVGVGWGPFFSTRPTDVDIAVSACNRCGLRDECLSWAVENEAYGIWGGLTAVERVELGGDPSGLRGHTRARAELVHQLAVFA